MTAEQSTVAWQLVAGALTEVAQLDSIEGLRLAVEIHDQLQRIQREHVETARANGRSWTEVGDALGVTRSAAQQRFGR